MLGSAKTSVNSLHTYNYDAVRLVTRRRHPERGRFSGAARDLPLNRSGAHEHSWHPPCDGFACHRLIPTAYDVPMKSVRAGFLLLVLAVASSLTLSAQVAYPEQEIHVNNLPPLTARSPHRSDVLATSLAILFNNPEVCCGKNSGLVDIVQSADPKSLKDIAAKLQGRHHLSDGRPIQVTAKYLSPDQINAGELIATILNQRSPLMMWNSHLYLVYGVTYVVTVDNTTGAEAPAIHKFLLQDVRYSDSRRNLAFDRLTDDLGKVQGLLLVQATPQ